MTLKEETINEVIKLLQDAGLVEKRRVSCKSQSSGWVSLDELEEFVEAMGIDESTCIAGSHGVGFAFGFTEAVVQITSFIQKKKPND
jgi:hypothetical protein